MAASRASASSNPTVTAFIGRNYERDERGCWFFQNGPQRVFVQLDYTPLVLRVVGASGAPLELEAHTGKRGGDGRGRVDRRGRRAAPRHRARAPASCTTATCSGSMPAFVDANGSPLEEDVLEELMDARRSSGAAVPLWLKFGETQREGRADPLRATCPARFGFVREPEPPAGGSRADDR